MFQHVNEGEKSRLNSLVFNYLRMSPTASDLKASDSISRSAVTPLVPSTLGLFFLLLQETKDVKQNKRPTNEATATSLTFDTTGSVRLRRP